MVVWFCCVIPNSNRCLFSRALLEANFTREQIVELERIKAMRELAKSENKVIYAPLPFYENGSTKLVMEERK